MAQVWCCYGCAVDWQLHSSDMTPSLGTSICCGCGHKTNKQNKTKQNKTSNNTKCWQGCGEAGSFINCWLESKMLQLLWKRVWWYLTKLYMYLPCNLENTLLDTYPREMKTYVYVRFIQKCL